MLPKTFTHLLALRRDFALELGFVETMRRPLPDSTRALVDRCLSLKSDRFDLADLNARRAEYRLPRFLGYYYAGTLATVTDGRNAAGVQYYGLFSQLLESVRAALRTRGFPEALTIVAADDDCAPFPPAMLIHNTATGQCYVAPFEAGREFLAAQAR